MSPMCWLSLHTNKRVCIGSDFVQHEISLTGTDMHWEINSALNLVPMTEEDMARDDQVYNGTLTWLSSATQPDN